MGEVAKYQKHHSSKFEVETVPLLVGAGLSAFIIPFSISASFTIVSAVASVSLVVSGFMLLKRKFQKPNVPKRIMVEIENFYFERFSSYNTSEIRSLFRQASAKNISESIIKSKLEDSNEFHVIIPSKVLAPDSQQSGFRKITTLALAVHYKDGILNIQTSEYEMHQFNKEFTAILSLNGDLEDLIYKASQTRNMSRVVNRKNARDKYQSVTDYGNGYSQKDRITFDRSFRKQRDNGPFSRGYWDRPRELDEPEHGRTVKIV